MTDADETAAAVDVGRRPPARQIVLGNGAVATLPGHGRRVGARAIDVVLGWPIASVPAATCFYLVLAVEQGSAPEDEWVYFEGLLTLLVGVPLSIVVWCCIAMTYEAGFFVRDGASFGKRMLGLRIVRAADGLVSRGRLAARASLYMALHSVLATVLLMLVGAAAATSLPCEDLWGGEGEQLWGLADCDNSNRGGEAWLLVICVLAVAALFVLNFWFLWGRRRQGLFDKMAGTLVVMTDAPAKRPSAAEPAPSGGPGDASLSESPDSDLDTSPAEAGLAAAEMSPAAAETSPTEPFEPQFASPGRRFGARAIDIGVVVLFGLTSNLLLSGLLNGADGFAQMTFGILTYAVLPVIHELIGVALFGRTLGKRLVGIEVRRLDGSQVGWPKSLVRFLIPFAGFNLFIVGGLLVWLSVLFDSERWQGWHDKAASTVVIRKHSA